MASSLTLRVGVVIWASPCSTCRLGVWTFVVGDVTPRHPDVWWEAVMGVAEHADY
jgi:hypothetical protein